MIIVRTIRFTNDHVGNYSYPSYFLGIAVTTTALRLLHAYREFTSLQRVSDEKNDVSWKT